MLESDSEDDSDYEDNAGEYALYDSPLEKTDELLFLKETLETIHNCDVNTYQFLVSSQTPEESNKMAEALNGVTNLIEREEACRRNCDALEEKMNKKGNKA